LRLQLASFDRLHGWRLIVAQMRGVDVFQFFDDRVHRRANLLLSMLGGDEETQAGGTFLDRRMQDWLDVNSSFEQGFRQLQRMQRVAQDHRDDGRVFTAASVETSAFGEREK